MFMAILLVANLIEISSIRREPGTAPEEG